MVQDVGNRLITAFQKQTEQIVYFCSVENVSPNLAVHEIRKSFKRLRAFLKFYAESPDEFFRDYNKQLLSHGKSLAFLRESYVKIQVFERVTSPNNLIPERKIKAAREKLVENNKSLLDKDFFENKSCSAIHDLRKQLESQFIKLKFERPTKKQLISQLCNSFLKSYTCCQNLNPGLDAVELHRLRKKLKVLYYQIDFFKFMRPKYFKLKSDQLNRITEQLGEDHDLYIFFNEIKKEEYDFGTSEIGILENQTLHLRELNLLKLTSRLKQLFSDSPDVFNQKMNSL